MIHIKRIVKTCDACPAQWDAETEDGRYVYIRYRYGFLSVSVDGERIVGKEVGDPLDGVMNFDELKVNLADEFSFHCQED